MALPKSTLDELRIERPQSGGRARGGRSVKGLLIWLIVMALIAAAAWIVLRPKAVEVKTVLAREVSAASADRTVLNASGYVTARRAATVSSKVTAKVLEVLVEEGKRVTNGQVLARLDDTNIRASLSLAEAQLKSAEAALAETRARLKEAELILRRTTDLAKSSISAQSELDHAEADASSLKARLAQQAADITVAQRLVATWEQQVDDTIIRAPFAGIVTSKNAQPGEMISPISAGGGFTRTGICTLVDMTSLEIETDVNESYINRVQAGQAVEATLDAYPDWKIPCKVIAIIPTADRQKSTVKVRVGFDQLDPRILPEMSIKVAFREPSAAGGNAGHLVIVPKNALRQADGRDFVWVVQNSRAERRAVNVASSGADEATVAAGIATGERVVLDPPSNMVDGMALKETKL